MKKIYMHGIMFLTFFARWDISASSTVRVLVPSTKSTQPTVQSNIVRPTEFQGKTGVLVAFEVIDMIKVWPATDVGDVYSGFQFSSANVDLVNEALEKGKDLIFTVDVQLNRNKNYNITATIADLEGHQIAQEVRNDVVNKGDTTNDVMKNAIISSSVASFTYYGLDVQFAGQDKPVEVNSLPINSSVIIATGVNLGLSDEQANKVTSQTLPGAAQIVQIPAQLHSMMISPETNVAHLLTAFKLSKKDLLRVNRAFLGGKTLKLEVSVIKNTVGNYNVHAIITDLADTNIVHVTQHNVVNVSKKTNGANIATGDIVPAKVADLTEFNLEFGLQGQSRPMQVNDMAISSVIILNPLLKKPLFTARPK